MDLWAQFRILDCGKRLGRYITHYRSAYFLPDKRSAKRVFTYKPAEGAEQMIYERISDITISMRSADYLTLPKCIINEVPVSMSEKERDSKDVFMRVQSEIARRGNLNPEGKRRVYSSRYALSGMVYCGHCGDIYRRVKRNNRGCKYTVWRCVSRVFKKRRGL